MRKIEIVLWIIFVFTAAMNHMFHWSALFVFLSGFTLGLFYFIFTPFIINDWRLSKRTVRDFFMMLPESRALGSLLVGYLYSFVIVSFLFHALHWPGASAMYLLSLLGLSTLSMIVIWKKRRTTEPSPFYQAILLRNLIWLVIISLLFVLLLFI